MSISACQVGPLPGSMEVVLWVRVLLGPFTFQGRFPPWSHLLPTEMSQKPRAAVLLFCLPPSLISLALLSHSHDNTVTLSHHVPTQVWVAEAVESLSHAAHPTPISNILQKSLGLLLPCCVALPADAGVVEVPTLTCDHEVSSSSLKAASSFLD